MEIITERLFRSHRVVDDDPGQYESDDPEDPLIVHERDIQDDQDDQTEPHMEAMPSSNKKFVHGSNRSQTCST